VIVRPGSPAASPGAGDSLTLVVDGNNVMGVRARGAVVTGAGACLARIERIGC
jgi:hypothetical protein